MRAIKCLVLHATFALALAGCESAPASWPEPLGLENARWERIDTDLGPAPALSLTNVAGDHLAWPGEHVTLHEVRLDTLEGGRWTMFALTFEQTRSGTIENAAVLGCSDRAPVSSTRTASRTTWSSRWRAWTASGGAPSARASAGES